MAAPAVPGATQLGRGFFVALVELITIASNLSLPVSYEVSQTGVISGTTASTIVSALNAQRDLL